MASAVGGFASNPWRVRVLRRQATGCWWRRRRGAGRRSRIGGRRRVVGGRPFRRALAHPALRRRRCVVGIRRGFGRRSDEDALDRPRVCRGVAGAGFACVDRVDGSEGGRVRSRRSVQVGTDERRRRDRLRASVARAGTPLARARGTRSPCHAKPTGTVRSPGRLPGISDRRHSGALRTCTCRGLARDRERRDPRRRGRCLGRRPRLPRSLARRSRRRPLVARRGSRSSFLDSRSRLGDRTGRALES